ncbi:MAG: tRNA pseudouridine(13) synthase TruD [Nitrososphaeria archaeon]|nr:tRNA pseudouridine(13) synthase TruD [Nitrososphaeria archaeon]
MDAYKPILQSLKSTDIEEFIGISRYISSTRGIGGIIKSKPEDFMIWEVLSTGEDSRMVFESDLFSKSGYGEELLCVMKKVKLDSIRAVSILARTLKIKSEEIGLCGIKDKMSISWQYVTIPANALNHLRVLRINELIEVKPFRFSPHKLSSRSLWKNVFQITIRNPSNNSIQLIDETLRELRARGVPNYYGHQRFGITRPINPIVGKLIMKGRLEEAVSAFLSDYSNLENKDNREVRRMLKETWDLRWALDSMPRSLVYELKMIESLLREPRDYVKCLRTLPLRLRRLIIESVASKIFNKALSKIIDEGRFDELEVGDIVLPIDANGRFRRRRPIIVTNRNIKQVERMVKDKKMVIALPVPGYLSPIPKSSKGEKLLEAMKEEDVDFEDFKVKHLPEVSSKGSLRPISIPFWSFSIKSVDEQSITIELSLPPSSYATIFLREIMKPENPLTYIGRLSAD